MKVKKPFAALVLMLLAVLLYTFFIHDNSDSFFDTHQKILNELAVKFDDANFNLDLSEKDKKVIEAVYLDGSAHQYQWIDNDDSYEGYCDSQRFSSLQNQLGYEFSCDDIEDRFRYYTKIDAGLYLCKDLMRTTLVKHESPTLYCVDGEMTDNAIAQEVLTLKRGMDTIAERKRNGGRSGWSTSFSDHCNGVFVDNRQYTYEKIGLNCIATENEYKIYASTKNGFYCVSHDGFLGFVDSLSETVTCN